MQHRCSLRHASRTIAFLFLAFCLLPFFRSSRKTYHLRDIVDKAVDDLVKKTLLSTFSKNDSRSSSGQASPFLHSLTHSTETNVSQDISRLCQLLIGKKILLVGPDTTYHLHSLWLRLLEDIERRSHRCLGRDYCTFHHICRPIISPNEAEKSEERKKKMPGRRILAATNSSLLLYSASSSLFASPNSINPKYTLPDVDYQTGVRALNTYWVKHARKADIVLLSRAPLAPPSWTYEFHAGFFGNWSYTRLLCKEYNYINRHCDYNLEHRLVNAGLHVTVNHFLPTLLNSLVLLSRDTELQKVIMAWHGTWYIQPICAGAGLPKHAALLRDIWSDSNNEGAVDPWTLYHNVQGSKPFLSV